MLAPFPVCRNIQRSDLPRKVRNIASHAAFAWKCSHFRKAARASVRPSPRRPTYVGVGASPPREPAAQPSVAKVPPCFPAPVISVQQLLGSSLRFPTTLPRAKTRIRTVGTTTSAWRCYRVNSAVAETGGPESSGGQRHEFSSRFRVVVRSERL